MTTPSAHVLGTRASLPSSVGTTGRPRGRDAALQASAIIAHHSKSFSLASRLLPADVAYEAQVLYAYCRHVDDAVDEAPLASQPAQLLALRDELDALYRGDEMSEPLLAALQHIVGARQVPRLYFEELIAGMAMDTGGHVYREQGDLLLYCYRVASTVGLMMCHIMGVRDDVALRHAAHLGIAMQLTNIARDVQEDWGRGRLYLPDDLLAEHGAGSLRAQLPAEPNGAPLPTAAAPAVAAAIGALLDTAERYYRSGDAGLGYLSPRCAFAVSVARRVYSDIGTSLRRQDCDPRAGRAFVTLPRKLWLVGRAFIGAVGRALRPPQSVGAQGQPLALPTAPLDAATAVQTPAHGSLGGVASMGLLCLCAVPLVVIGCGPPPEPMTAADFDDDTSGEQAGSVTPAASAALSTQAAETAVVADASDEPEPPSASHESAEPTEPAESATTHATSAAAPDEATPARAATTPSGEPALIASAGAAPMAAQPAARTKARSRPTPRSNAPKTKPAGPRSGSASAQAARGPGAPKDPTTGSAVAPVPAATPAPATPATPAAAVAPKVGAPAPKTTGQVVVDVIGFENTKGQVLVALWRHSKGFPEQGRRADGKKRIWPKGRRARVVFEDVPPGRFSVAVHHDEDKDFEMDTGLFGIPSEGYGFSRDALGNFGPPSFEDASYVLGQGERKQIRIKMRY